MNPREAEKIGELLGQFDNASVSPCFDLGSSTAHFRNIKQPQIDKFIFSPLRERGVKIFHVDAKSDEGVDLSGDIFDAAFQAEILSLEPQLILCCSFFEHVIDREALVEFLVRALKPGGLLLVTVPYSYPYHPDPIDTYYRPSPQQIAALFPDFTLLDSGIIKGTTHLKESIESMGILNSVKGILKNLIKSVCFWRISESRKARIHRYLWLWRHYQSSWVLLQKP